MNERSIFRGQHQYDPQGTHSYLEKCRRICLAALEFVMKSPNLKA